MTPLDFLRSYEPDRWTRVNDDAGSPLRIDEGDRVGVVLFNLGGPETLDDVETFLYNLLMDPAVLSLPVGGRLRRWLAQSVARVRAGALRDHYEVIGGGSPLTRLAREQAATLQDHLSSRYGKPTGVDFRVYLAMRYWHPFGNEVAAQMAEDGVDKVVLLPSYPQYSTATTGSALAHWAALAETGERPSWPTTVVEEYAANPKYVQAVSERIDEALQRFPRNVRDEVVLFFSAHDTPLQARDREGDPYCCLVHSTVEQVMRLRDQNRSFRTAFQSLVGPNRWLSPSTLETVTTLARQGHRAVLVVPVSFVTDHVNTSYELDIGMRERVEACGITHFEVTAGLNTHPLFIEALGEATLAQLDLPVDVNQLRHGGDGHSHAYPLRPLSQLPRHDLSDDAGQCPDCGRLAGARRWTEWSGEPEMSSERPAAHPDEPANSPSESRSTEES